MLESFGVDFETRTMPICPGMSQYELEIFANQRIVIILPSTDIPTHIHHVPHSCHIRHRL